MSLARRMQDPMAELLAMEIRDLGLGHSLSDVHQGILNRQLDAVVASCLALVGVDVNRASLDLLARVPGLDRDRARHIVEHRSKHGGFKTLAALRDVDGIDDATFTHMAGFLRVIGGDDPLDSIGIHPDDYGIANAIAAQQGVPVQELFGKSLAVIRR